MVDLSAHLKTVTRISFFFLSICFLLWAAMPAYQSIIAGLIIGAAASLINAYHLAWKVKRIAGHAERYQQGRKPNMGFLTRACIALLAVVIATRYFDYSLGATVVGLFLTQLVTLVLGIILPFVKNNQSADERGDKE